MNSASLQSDPPAATRILFIRHGLVHNPGDMLYGRLPRMRLAAEGIDQAQATGIYLHSTPLAAVYSSPLLRARQTAHILLQGRAGLRLHISGLLNEVYTPFAGQPLGKIAALDWNIYARVTPPHETPADLLARVLKFIQRVRRRHAGEVAAAVTHGDVIAFTILWAKGQAIAPGFHNDLQRFGLADSYPQHASITAFTFHSTEADELPEVTYVNTTPSPDSAAGSFPRLSTGVFPIIHQ